jgi:hypothetical protein
MRRAIGRYPRPPPAAALPRLAGTLGPLLWEPEGLETRLDRRPLVVGEVAALDRGRVHVVPLLVLVEVDDDGNWTGCGRRPSGPCAWNGS